MSSIYDTIQTDLKAALKRGDAFSVSVLRMLQSAMHNRALEKRARLVKEGGSPEDAVLAEEEVIATIRSEVKRRKEAAIEFEKGNRPELSEKELKEAAILEAYLPAEPDDAAVERAAADAIQEIGRDPKQFGKIMGTAMKKLPGVSASRVSAAVKKLLED